MHRTTLDLELVTPCFCGGSDPAASAEWRAQSVRGQLRWWFRAVAGPVVGVDVEEMRALEASIFGDTAIPSAIRIETLGVPEVWPAGPRRGLGPRLSAEDLVTVWWRNGHGESEEAAIERLKVFPPSNPNREVKTNPLHYLGYGCIDMKGLTRSCLAPETEVQLRISWAPRHRVRARPRGEELFARALQAWLLVGGLGSRARNGWGSFAVKLGNQRPTKDREPNLRAAQESSTSGTSEGLDETVLVPRSRKHLVDACRGLLSEFADYGEDLTTLQWSQLSRHSRIFIGREPHFDWQSALSRAGAWAIAFRRRYGWPKEQRERQGLRLATRDYAWAAPRGRTIRGDLPDRAGFGLPLPFGEHGEVVTWFDPDDPGRSGDPRRASTLHMHIAKVGDRYYPVLTYIPSRFLPGRGEIRFKNAVSPSKSPTPEQLDVVERFLDDIEAKDLVERVAP